VTELKGEIDTLKIVVGDFNIPLSIRDRLTRQRSASNRRLEQYYKPTRPLAGICRTLYMTTTDTHSSQVHMEHFSG